jgi:hypothetical protein
MCRVPADRPPCPQQDRVHVAPPLLHPRHPSTLFGPERRHRQHAQGHRAGNTQGHRAGNTQGHCAGNTRVSSWC